MVCEEYLSSYNGFFFVKTHMLFLSSIHKRSRKSTLKLNTQYNLRLKKHKLCIETFSVLFLPGMSAWSVLVAHN